MKNALKYYYNLDISTIHQKNKNFYFNLDGFEYLFIKYENLEEIEAIYELASNLNIRGIYTHQIVLNNSRKILTKINEDDYILMKIFVTKEKIQINDIIQFNNINYVMENTKLKRDNWDKLWSDKVDYLEYQVNQMGKKYPLIRQSFSYYVGLAENAIILVKNTSREKIPLSLSHRRILYSDTTYNLYNPLNVVFDLRIRDVCEYFKSCFFNNQDILNEVRMYLYYNKLDYNESCFFLARMLFPTYYFDIYEKIINNEIDESKLNSIISKVKEYELFLKNIYLFLKNSVNIPDIEWLAKMN